MKSKLIISALAAATLAIPVFAQTGSGASSSDSSYNTTKKGNSPAESDSQRDTDGTLQRAKHKSHKHHNNNSSNGTSSDTGAKNSTGASGSMDNGSRSTNPSNTNTGR